jgi:hypothetical protein
MLLSENRTRVSDKDKGKSRQDTKAFEASALAGTAEEEADKLLNIPGTRRYAPAQVSSSRAD